MTLYKHLESFWNEKPVPNEYPYSFGLNSFKTLGKARNSRHVPWPPIDHAKPLNSMKIWGTVVASAPKPTVRESPMA